MKKMQWIKLTVLVLVFAMALSLFACQNGDTGNSTDAESESSFESNTESDTTGSTEDESSSETEKDEEAVDPDSIIYGEGEKIANAGDGLMDDAFVFIEREIDESAATDISASELLALLAEKTSTAEGQVYRVKEPLVLESNTKYYGNLATVIAEGGIIIKDVENVVIKELIVKGSVKIEGSSAITIFRLDITSDSVGVSADEQSYDIAIKNCRVNAVDTAISTGADLSSIYQNYLCADRGIVSTGDDMAVQNNRISVISLGISSSGTYCTIKNNSVNASFDGVGIILSKGSYNGLVALNDLTGAQLSLSICEGYNCSVILNSAIRFEATNNTNTYIIDNSLGGALELINNKYLICDGNTLPQDDGIIHPIIDKGNTECNGDTLHDVDARLDVGADEKLLPHTNKDLFLSMERRSSVRDLSQTKNYDFNGYIRNIAKEEKIVILPPGAYSISSTLNLQAAHSNTTVYAYGVYQEATDYIKNVDIRGTNNISIKGLTIGYAKQSAGQIQVLEKLGNNQLLVISSAGFTKEFGSLDNTKFSGGGGYFFHPGEYTGWTELGNWGKYVIVPNENGQNMNEDGTFVIQLSGGKDIPKYYSVIEKGEILTCRLNETNDRTVAISNSSNVLFKDTVTYGYADALCFVIGGIGKNVQFYRHHNLAHSASEIDKETYDKYVQLEQTYGVDLEVYIDEQGRYRGADPRIGSVDATHIPGATQGLTAISTLFENACDDASNQRGNSSCLHKVVDNGDGTLTIYYKDYLPETYYNMYKNQGKEAIQPGHNVSDFAAGDRIFIYASNGKIFCDTTVLTGSAVYRDKVVIYEEDYILNKQEYHLAWASSVKTVTIRKSEANMAALEGYDTEKSGPSMDNKVIVDNISRNSVDFTFDNCMVRHNRGRFVVKTRNATIVNCTFKDTSMGGVVMSVESTWGESSVPQNITVDKCVFDGTSQTFNYQNNTKYAAVAVEGLGSAGVAVNLSTETIPCRNITITNNVFRNVPNNYYVTVSAAQGITIKDNVFETRSTETDQKIGKAIYISGCMNIMIEGNSYSSFAEGDVSKVVIGNNYKNLYGSDVEGVLQKENIPETETEAAN